MQANGRRQSEWAKRRETLASAYEAVSSIYVPKGPSTYSKIALELLQSSIANLMKTTQQRKGLLDHALGAWTGTPSLDSESFIRSGNSQFVCRFRFPSLGKITGLLSPSLIYRIPATDWSPPCVVGGFVHFKGRETNRQRAAPPLIVMEELCGCGQVDSELLHQLCSGFVSRHFTSAEERLPTNNRTGGRSLETQFLPLAPPRKLIMGNLWRESVRD